MTLVFNKFEERILEQRWYPESMIYSKTLDQLHSNNNNNTQHTLKKNIKRKGGGIKTCTERNSVVMLYISRYNNMSTKSNPVKFQLQTESVI